jgi:hypothetical protein
MNNPPSPEQLIIDQNVTNRLIQVARIDANLTQEIFITTVDKARLCLNNALQRMERRQSWIAPAGILATLIVVFPTSSFHDCILTKDTWHALFLLVALLNIGWLGHAFWKRPKSVSVDGVIEELRKGSSTLLNSRAPVQSELELSYASARLVIHSAKYGAKGIENDVTELLQSKVSADKLKIAASNRLGGDPFPNEPKELVVDYSHKGERRIITVKEGNVLSLPE